MNRTATILRVCDNELFGESVLTAVAVACHGRVVDDSITTSRDSGAPGAFSLQTLLVECVITSTLAGSNAFVIIIVSANRNNPCSCDVKTVRISLRIFAFTIIRRLLIFFSIPSEARHLAVLR